MRVGRRISEHVRGGLGWRLGDDDVARQVQLGRDAAVGRLDELHMNVVALGQVPDHEVAEEGGWRTVELCGVGQA